MIDAHREWIRHGWVEAADGMAAVLELVRVKRILFDRIDQTLKPFELSFARYEILMLLSFTRRGALSIGTLGRLLQIHPTSVTSTVDRLERQDLVQRVRSERDRRVVTVRITPKGRHVAAGSTEALNTEVFVCLGLTDGQSMKLWTLLRSFRANAGDFSVLPDRERRSG